ncbi:MBL fold metallo-hydrolase [Pseudobacillus wudalianchiensis]|uniref:Zn-dependent hydrolase n=1 Tax=Pseudobacillus wudalianchiensis TaxID=1743143 RepID=A0A1B9AZA5_9BACI|nr:MBL fold metallo-hydrolase [Bacillus wudalianchiensis]OCA89083.1 Zn-dependent hydrolase [Bacillus wudalianchiensis]
MFFRSYFDEKLAQYSYMVACQKTGEAIVIDPARDITPYVETAKKEGFQLTAATETHIHADFVSGARQLANDYGVTLYLSDEGDENWKYQYTDNLSVKLVKDGDVFMVGNVEFKVMHTPGHTPESISFVLTDKGGGSTEPMGIFTGDFVFVGDVGRPDLLEKAAGVKGTANSGAAQMYESIKKFKQLPDYLVVWPGHGAGSACGKSLGAVPLSTVGYEKANNWALQEMDKDEFQKELLKDQPEPPKYFAVMKKVNKVGPAILTNETIPYVESYKDLESYLVQEDTMVIDTRLGSEFAQGHIEGTINLPYTKIFTNWAGWILDYEKKLVVIAEKEQAADIKRSLESIGLDNLVSFASPSVVSEAPELEKYVNIDVDQLKAQYEKDDVYVVDIRQQGEWEAGHIPTAHHHMLGYLEEEAEELPKDKKIIVHCQSGARSAIGTSLLQAKGFKNIENMASGFAGWKREGGPIKQL